MCQAFHSVSLHSLKRGHIGYAPSVNNVALTVAQIHALERSQSTWSGAPACSFRDSGRPRGAGDSN